MPRSPWPAPRRSPPKRSPRPTRTGLEPIRQSPASPSSLPFETRAQVDAKQTGRGLVLTLGGVLFDFNSAELKPEGRLSAARVAGFLIALDNRDAVIEGHADNTGDADYNVKLSLRRAESIRNALVEFGVSEDRMVAEGYGANFPIASNDIEEGRAQNRRVEIVILRVGLSASEAHR